MFTSGAILDLLARQRLAWIGLVFTLSALLGACKHKPAPSEKPVSSTTAKEPAKEPTRPPLATAKYVGSERCQSCHSAAFTQWQGSHHQLAMQQPTKTSVLGDFANQSFRYFGETTKFRAKDGTYEVRTEGLYKAPEGDKEGTQSFKVKYTFGVEPLQQYLVDVGKGHLQTLPFSYDTRPKEAGGQRWYHLYGEEHIRRNDPLHWSAAVQNWNHVCADCHSTDLQKRFDAKSGVFETQFSEISVGCEACHGPASNHVQQATTAASGNGAFDATKGLPRNFSKSAERQWIFKQGERIAALANRTESVVHGNQEQLSACAKCHSRRGDLGGNSLLFDDRYRLELLQDLLYFPDGQIRDEVYVYGSFIQSKMHANGVVCGDCHEPHTAKLRAQGNQLCGKCHSAKAFDTPEHHFHQTAGKGTECVQCHMPTRRYMGVDDRHDHRFGVPRPDLTLSLGVPNACTDSCHSQKDAQAAAHWAKQEIEKRFGGKRPDTFANALHAARQIRPGGDQLLLQVVKNKKYAPIVRATALLELGGYPNFDSSTLSSHQRDPDPLVRRALAQLAVSWPEPQLSDLLHKLLSDRVRSVRLEAVRGLLNANPTKWSSAKKRTFKKVKAELRASLEFNRDRAGALLDLARLELTSTAPTQPAKPNLAAEKLFRQALKRDPSFTGAYINFADYYRSIKRDDQAEVMLKVGLPKAADRAQLEHALGLTLVRLKRMKLALTHLGKAHDLRPDLPRFGFVYGVALWELGQAKQAIAVLESTHERFQGDLQVLQALAQFHQITGNTRRAAELQAKAVQR